jgi:hypothetical protein
MKQLKVVSSRVSLPIVSSVISAVLHVSLFLFSFLAHPSFCPSVPPSLFWPK